MNSNIEAIIASAGLGSLKNVSSVSGGSINEAYCIETQDQKLFLKVNEADRYPKMFEAEGAGLILLSETDFVVPEPKLVGERNGLQFVVMKWIESGFPSPGFWNEFGRSLAKMHLLTADEFGLDHDNYIGSLPQLNTWKNSWAEFYREERLQSQMELADKHGRLSPKMKIGFESFFEKLEDIYPEEKPSLLHGDLWSGNLMVDSNGRPSIFDPAVCYGHREMDLAMMTLFGGFGDSWIDSYNEIYPLENGWQERIEIGQLYPLMVHVNLFGGSYKASVESILQKFV